MKVFPSFFFTVVFEMIHNNLDDTICAIATALSPSGLSVIRVSGKDSIGVVDKMFKSVKEGFCLENVDSHSIHYGYIVDNSGKTVDEVLVLVMRAPRSFTAEDTVEIDCHGGIFVTEYILNLCINNGARLADPGEFTKRAFVNGRIDLSAAEAVCDLINAKNDFAHDSAMDQVKGRLYDEISLLRDEIITDTAFIEAALDDPEHYSVDGFSEILGRNVDKWVDKVCSFVNKSRSGMLLKEGISTAIVGKPNVGKSSIFNLLCGRQRAIVTDIPGTTRDVLDTQVRMGQIILNITDTAGIRDADDEVEKIGVEKSREMIQKADLVLFVCDVSGKIDDADRDIFNKLHGVPVIVLANKCDTGSNIYSLNELSNEFGEGVPIILFSARTGSGLDELENKILKMFFEGNLNYNDEVTVTNIRQVNALKKCLESLGKVKESILMNMEEDFFTIDLMDAYNALGEITGETAGDDLIDNIFGKFCMGK